ncbi:MAG: esterase family protein [Deltaproteobacteria bacterium]|nr:esterase family protein [Deltaproteobacteria bacterium]
MHTDYQKWWSPALGQDMELKVYGRSGKPMIVFPSSGGRFYEYEDFGMVEACRPFIDDDRIQLFTLDSVDGQSWLNRAINPVDRAGRHDAYERYVRDEVAPFINSRNRSGEKFLASGCSMGAFHAANFLFRLPGLFNAVIGLSGLYGPNYLLDNYRDSRLYYYFPLLYLPNLEDPYYLNRYRQSRIILCVGQGPWERCDQYDCIGETRALGDILSAKGVPAWVDFWGPDVSHDWPWWRVQAPYFLARL